MLLAGLPVPLYSLRYRPFGGPALCPQPLCVASGRVLAASPWSTPPVPEPPGYRRTDALDECSLSGGFETGLKVGQPLVEVDVKRGYISLRLKASDWRPFIGPCYYAEAP